MAVVLDPYALVDLDTTKDHLGIPAGTLDYDDRIKLYINASSTRIESFLDRKILTRSYTEYYDGRRTNELLLKQWPASKPTELWIDPTGQFTDSASYQQDSDAFELHHDTYVILLENRTFVPGVRNIKVVYSAGYSTTPNDLLMACLFHVEWYWDINNDRSLRVDTKSKNSESANYLQEWPEWFRTHLEPYRRYEFANSNNQLWNG